MGWMFSPFQLKYCCWIYSGSFVSCLIYENGEASPPPHISNSVLTRCVSSFSVIIANNLIKLLVKLF